MGEWLKRLPLSIRAIYEKVRYGRQTLRDDELKQFNEAITSVKSQIEKPEKKKWSRKE